MNVDKIAGLGKFRFFLIFGILVLFLDIWLFKFYRQDLLAMDASFMKDWLGSGNSIAFFFASSAVLAIGSGLMRALAWGGVMLFRIVSKSTPDQRKTNLLRADKMLALSIREKNEITYKEFLRQTLENETDDALRDHTFGLCVLILLQDYLDWPGLIITKLEAAFPYISTGLFWAVIAIVVALSFSDTPAKNTFVRLPAEDVNDNDSQEVYIPPRPLHQTNFVVPKEQSGENEVDNN